MAGEEYTGHIRAMRADNEFFGAEDLVGLPDMPFQIVKCMHYDKRKGCGQTFNDLFTLFLADEKGRQCSKELMLRATNRKSIARMYGGNVKDWKGKWIWLYVTEVRSPQGGMTLGIRIRDKSDAPSRNAPPNQEEPKEPTPDEQETQT